MIRSAGSTPSGYRSISTTKVGHRECQMVWAVFLTLHFGRSSQSSMFHLSSQPAIISGQFNAPFSIAVTTRHFYSTIKHHLGNFIQIPGVRHVTLSMNTTRGTHQFAGPLLSLHHSTCLYFLSRTLRSHTLVWAVGSSFSPLWVSHPLSGEQRMSSAWVGWREFVFWDGCYLAVHCMYRRRLYCWLSRRHHMVGDWNHAYTPVLFSGGLS